jgi:hypothetical protein
MIGAFLPLPPDPQSEKLPEASTAHPLRTRVLATDESQYQGARWWRQLNRYMSVVGLLVIAAVVTLTILGVRQRWGSQSP